MNLRCLVITGMLAIMFASGCSTTSTGPAVDDDDKVYVTGSRIPRSDRSSAGTKSTSDPDQIRTMMQPRTVGTSSN